MTRVMAKKPINFVLNGSDTSVFVEQGGSLLDELRKNIGDLSAKYGCAQGTCGACTVLIEGEPHLSCLVMAERVQGKHIETNNGLAEGPDLHPLQKAFVEGFAAQCGYCTSGMLMAAKALLKQNPDPTRDQVAEAISGNLCRCTGYEPIIDAILAAAQNMRGRSV